VGFFFCLSPWLAIARFAFAKRSLLAVFLDFPCFIVNPVVSGFSFLFPPLDKDSYRWGVHGWACCFPTW
jgi:ABC-type sulfate transport system permease subunit